MTDQCWNKYLFWDESNIEYYSSDENWTNRISNIICSWRKYSNIIRIPKNIRIFEYIRIFVSTLWWINVTAVWISLRKIFLLWFSNFQAFQFESGVPKNSLVAPWISRLLVQVYWDTIYIFTISVTAKKGIPVIILTFSTAYWSYGLYYYYFPSF